MVNAPGATVEFPDEESKAQPARKKSQPTARRWGIKFIRLTMKITDRRQRRALAAHPSSKEPGASELKRLAAVRVHRVVGPFVYDTIIHITRPTIPKLARTVSNTPTARNGRYSHLGKLP